MRSLIRREGNDITVHTEPPYKTKAIISKHTSLSSTNSSQMLHSRRIYMENDTKIKTGVLLSDSIRRYIVVGVYEEYLRGRVLDKVSHVLDCNCKYTNIKYKITTSDTGKITKTIEESIVDTYAHLSTTRDELIQYKPGLHKDTEYVMYSPVTEVVILDTLSIDFSDITLKLKVLTIDFITYPGLLLLELCNETRFDNA